MNNKNNTNQRKNKNLQIAIKKLNQNLSAKENKTENPPAAIDDQSKISKLQTLLTHGDSNYTKWRESLMSTIRRTLRLNCLSSLNIETSWAEFAKQNIKYEINKIWYHYLLAHQTVWNLIKESLDEDLMSELTEEINSLRK